MRFKTVLGLLAIGGAIAYAQKKRGGELSLRGIKNSLRDVLDIVMGKPAQEPAGATTRAASTDIAAGTRSGLGTDDDSAGPSGGFASSFGPSSVDHR
jgi:hypothetical protein